MYFYRIEVYHSFTEPTYMIMSHKYYFDNHQLNIIVQEAFDECIEKYSNKLSYDKGEEPCRMAVETIFEEYLPLQLKNHGFKIIKINETCSIRSGVLFVDGGAGNSVLKNRYKDKILPPCRKCIRKEYDGYNGCIVPNIVKTSNRCYIEPFDEKEENTKDDFNISVLKQYFIYFKNSIEKIEIARIALDDFFDSYDFNDCWIDHDIKVGSEHEGDIFCGFDLDTDMKRGKKLLEKYGVILEDDEDGFWITGVKE